MERVYDGECLWRPCGSSVGSTDTVGIAAVLH